MLLNYISAWHLINFFGTCYRTTSLHGVSYHIFGTCYWTTFLHDISLISLAHVTELHHCTMSHYHVFDTCYRTTALHDISYVISASYYWATPLHNVSLSYLCHMPPNYMHIVLYNVWHMLPNYITSWRLFNFFGTCYWTASLCDPSYHIFGTCYRTTFLHDVCFIFWGTCYWTTSLHDISLISLAHVTELNHCMTSL